MIRTRFENLQTILCLGCHADDIEIGCGGTILKMLAEQPGIKVCWVVLSAEGERASEARASAEYFLASAGEREILVQNFRDRFFPYQGESIKEFFLNLQKQVVPDVVFTHRLEDRHQDHRVVSELTWNTFRDQPIMEYEIPKYEGDLGHPNVLVPLDEATARQKVETITTTFASQRGHGWFSAETFWSLLRLRGLECNAPAGLAEGLTCRKLTL